MKVYALTGGIAVGKSSAVARLRESPGPAPVIVLDADEITHLLQRPDGAAYQPLLKRFPSVFRSSSASAQPLLDRAALGAIVFEQTDAGRAAKRALEAIMQPLILRHILRQLLQLWWSLPADGVVIVDAPTLLEMKRALGVFVTTPFSGVVVVSTSKQNQLARLMSRDGCTQEAATRRIASQLPLEEKEKAADFVIRNDGSVDELAQSAAAALRWMRAQSTTFNGFNRFCFVAATAAVGVIALVGLAAWKAYSNLGVVAVKPL